ncbi:MAG: hypothetical protein U9Q15_01755 [Patescibacteria group bacterium]|nr:hypothetical protein [Patescibacteria group bacterium]
MDDKTLKECRDYLAEEKKSTNIVRFVTYIFMFGGFYGAISAGESVHLNAFFSGLFTIIGVIVCLLGVFLAFLVFGMDNDNEWIAKYIEERENIEK